MLYIGIVCTFLVIFFFPILLTLQILDLNPGQIWFVGEITTLHTAGINWY